MKPHVKIYLDTFKYSTQEEIMCEKCGRPSNDIHHIDPRGMGGKNKHADRIDNLMALCRECHAIFGDKKQFKQMLRDIHQGKLITLLDREAI